MLIQILKEDPNGWFMVRKGAMSGLFPGNYLEKVTPWQSSWKSVSCLCQLCFLYLLVRLQFYYFVINLSYIPTLIQTNQSNLSCLYNFKYFLQLHATKETFSDTCL